MTKLITFFTLTGLLAVAGCATQQQLVGQKEDLLAAAGFQIRVSDTPHRLAAMLAGHLTTRAERNALLHFWRYNGYLMGCDPAWFPPANDTAMRVTSSAATATLVPAVD